MAMTRAASVAELDLPVPMIAIVGAGASGALTAIQLLRRARRPLGIVLLDGGSPPGCGIAYGTPFEAHLLNVRAGNMSAFPDEPLHFVNWLRNAEAEVGDTWRTAAASDFAPRRVYGQYLEATLRAAQASASDNVRCEVRSEDVVGLATDQQTLALRGGGTLRADRTVLALGNFRPQPLLGSAVGLVSGDQRVQNNPWAVAAVDDLAAGDAVFLVGTGLTMVDLVVSLVLERRHQGPIYAVSRRGQLPQVHADTGGYTRTWSEQEVPTDAAGLLRHVRAEVKRAAAQGYDWRGVVDSLRPVTQLTWQRAPAVERERFLRHLQPYWDTHRHRVAPRIGSVLTDARSAGQLSVWAGRIVRLASVPHGVDVEVVGRRGGRSTFQVARVINCTGPAVNVERLNDPLVASLLSGGLGRPDTLHLGLATTNGGRLVDASGAPSARLLTLGPMRRGELWETTAVPDIRVQAAELANLLVSELGVS